ncbi:MAG: acetate--CoA ligase family protein [Patescibacteria group bacterium]
MSLSNFLKPSAIVLVGASSHPAKIGHQILKNIINSGFSGKIYPVNLKGGRLLGWKVYQSLEKLPSLKKVGALVVIAIPAPLVLPEVERAGRLGFKNLVIISAGFRESGAEGVNRENQLRDLAQKFHLNILGPNCLGFINNRLPLNLSFAQALPASSGQSTGLAFLSQSGALGSALLDWCRAKNLNFELFISLGNQTVLSDNDFLELILNDKSIKAVYLYLEEITAGSKFISLVSRLSKRKPVFVLLSGLTEQGAQAAKSHTGSLLGSSSLAKLALKRSGAVILENLSALFNSLEFWSSQKWSGDSPADLFIVSNAGGPAVLSADAAAQLGLTLSPLSPGLAKEMKRRLPMLDNYNNPLDILGDADPQRYELALKTIFAKQAKAQVLVLLTAQTMTDPMSVAKVMVKTAKAYPKQSLAASFIGGAAVQAAKDYLSKNNIAVFASPEEFLGAYQKLFNYIKGRASLQIYVAPKSLSKKPILAPAGFYDYIGSLELLRSYGIKVIKTIKYADWRPGVLKFPVVLKAVGPDFVHKSESRAVILNLPDDQALKAAVRRLNLSFKRQLRSPLNYFVVQESGQGRQEMILGFKRDKVFGPVLMFGQGGIYTEVFKDIVFSLPGFDQKQALELIKQLKIYPVLNGARGQKAYDLKALIQAILDLSRLALEHPEIKELDINPLFLKDKGALAVDVRIII